MPSRIAFAITVILACWISMAALAADGRAKKYDASPSKRWTVMRSKVTEDRVTSNEFTLRFEQGETAFERSIGIPGQSLVTYTLSWPVYEFDWSKDEKWMSILVTYHYGTSLFVVNLEDRKKGAFPVKECLQILPGEKEAPKTYRQIDRVAFDAGTLVYDIAVLVIPSQDQVARDSLVCDLKKWSFRKAKKDDVTNRDGHR